MRYTRNKKGSNCYENKNDPLFKMLTCLISIGLNIGIQFRSVSCIGKQIV